jgi:hypothetical protein
MGIYWGGKGSVEYRISVFSQYLTQVRSETTQVLKVAADRRFVE